MLAQHVSAGMSRRKKLSPFWDGTEVNSASTSRLPP
jgi:hypothetical protein